MLTHSNIRTSSASISVHDQSELLEAVSAHLTRCTSSSDELTGPNLIRLVINGLSRTFSIMSVITNYRVISSIVLTDAEPRAKVDVVVLLNQGGTYEARQTIYTSRSVFDFDLSDLAPIG